MIHEILTSDIGFAQGMMDSGHPDAEILEYLASRSLDPAKAAQLVDDLRHGRKPKAQLPSELLPVGRSVVGGLGTTKGEVQSAQHSHHQRSGSRRHKGSGIPWWFVILFLIAVLAFGYVFLEAGSGVATDGANIQKHELPPPLKQP
jgi:hypothetical protein